MLELEAGRAQFFKGTWHAWRKEKAQRELALGRAIEKQEAEIAQLERFVDPLPRGHARAPGAVAREEARQDRPRSAATRATARRSASPSSRPSAPAASSSRSRTASCRSATATLLRRRRAVARARRARLAGRRQRLRQDDADHGARRASASSTAASCARGHNVKLGLLSQHAEELGSTGTVLEAAQRATGLTPNEARSLLGQFLFSGEEAEKPLDGLSGGERRRLSLAILVALRRQRPDPRRADQPPRPREPRGARGGAAGLPGRAAADLPRPRAARRRRHAHGRGRGPDAALLRRRLARVRARARGARARPSARPSAPKPAEGRRRAPAPRPPPARRRTSARAGREARGARSRRPRRARGARGGARRPARLERPALGGEVDRAPRRGQAPLEELYAQWEAVRAAERNASFHRRTVHRTVTRSRDLQGRSRRMTTKSETQDGHPGRPALPLDRLGGLQARRPARAGPAGVRHAARGGLRAGQAPRDGLRDHHRPRHDRRRAARSPTAPTCSSPRS